jgi:predicted ATPase
VKLHVELFGEFRVVRTNENGVREVIDFERARFKGTDLLLAHLCFYADDKSPAISDSKLNFKSINSAVRLNDLAQTLVGLRDLLEPSRAKGESFFFSKFHASQPQRPAKSYIRIKMENAAIDVQEYIRLVHSDDPASLAEAARFLKKGLLPQWAGHNWVATARTQVANLYLSAVGRLSAVQLQACRELPLLVRAFGLAIGHRLPKCPFPPPGQANEVVHASESFVRKLFDARRFTLLLALAGDLRSAYGADWPQVKEAAALLEKIGIERINFTQPAGYIDRCDPVADSVERHFTEESSPVVSLTGIGGMGKSTVAKMVGRRLHDLCFDRVYFVGLERLTDIQTVPYTIAQTLGLQHTNDPVSALRQYLVHKNAVLILDNCELFLGPSANPLMFRKTIEHLLSIDADLRILITSRAAVGFPGEKVETVLALAYPALDEPYLWETVIEEYRAVHFFVEKIARWRARETLSPADIDHIVHICRFVQGIPLALEIAAAALSRRSLAWVRENLTDIQRWKKKDFLDPKHETIQSCLDWSYELLSPSARRLFGCISLFPGGWNRQALDHIWQAANDSDAIDSLEQEVADASLVTLCGDRGRMLHLVRMYACDRFEQEEPLASLTRQRFIQYYSNLAAARGSGAIRADMAEALAEFDEESENFEQAIDFASGGGNDHEALEIACSLMTYWTVRGFLHQREALLKPLLARVSENATVLRGRGLVAAGVLAYFAAEYVEAFSLCRHGLKLLEGQTSDPKAAWSYCVGLVVAGIARFFEPKVDSGQVSRERNAAENQLLESVRVANAIGDIWLQALALSAHVMLQARRHYLESKACPAALATELIEGAALASQKAKHTQNPWLISLVLVNEAATLLHTQDDTVAAMDLYKDALKIRYDGGDRYGVLQTVGLIAFVMSMQGVREHRKDYLVETAVLLGAQAAAARARMIPEPRANAEMLFQARNDTATALAEMNISFDLLYNFGERLSEDSAVQLALGRARIIVEGTEVLMTSFAGTL